MKEGSICNKCNHRAYCAMSDEANNDNATIKGCYLYSERTAKTNADRIRNMGDIELANFLSGLTYGCVNCPMYYPEEYDECGKHCNTAWQEWVKQESDGE